MYGNGVKTGMVEYILRIVHRPILQDHYLALAVFSVAAAGTAMRGTAECRFVAAAVPAAGSTSTASALLFRNYNYIP